MHTKKAAYSPQTPDRCFLEALTIGLPSARVEPPFPIGYVAFTRGPELIRPPRMNLWLVDLDGNMRLQTVFLVKRQEIH